MAKTYNFSIALLRLKHGHKVKREGWNGKEQYIELGSNVSFKQPDGEIINSNHLDMGNKVIVFHGTNGTQVNLTNFLHGEKVIVLPDLSFTK